MPLPIAYSRRALIQRIIRQITNNTFAPDEFAITDKEICLHIDDVVAERIVGQAYAGAKVEGVLVVPEAYLVTYTLAALQQDPLTREWFVALPQPPIALPLGYSITRIYPVSDQFGIGQDLALIKSNRVSRRKNMPLQTGIRAWVENNTLWCASFDGSMLDQVTLRIQLPSARTTDMDAVMNLPESDLNYIFDTVVKKLMPRYAVPQDIINDGITAGNKSS